MGCTNANCLVQVTFESTKKQASQPLTSYKTLRTWINSSFPDLSQKAYRIQLETEPPQIIKNSQDYQQIYKKYSGKLSLHIVLEKLKRYRPDLFDKLTNWIFKVRKNNEDVEATGFMLSPRMCLIGVTEGQYNYHALFEDGSTLEFKQNGVLLVIGKFSLIELEVTNDWISKHLSTKQILLDPSGTVKKVVVFYYCRSRAILQELVQEDTKLEGFYLMFNAKSSMNCTTGSPVFNDQGKVVAIYESEGKATLIGKFIQEIEAVLDSVDISFQEAVQEAVVLSGVNIKLPEIVPDPWANYSVFIDTIKSSLVYTDQKSVNFTQIEAKTGSSVTITPLGIVITGQDDSGNKRKAWVFDGKTVKSLKDMSEKHLNHSSLFFMNLVFVVSGSFSKAVEAYDFHSQTWLLFNNLPGKRSFTSLLVYKKSLYLFGGLKSKKQVSKSILCLKDKEWIKIQLKLPEKLAGLGAFQRGKHEIIIFGGFNSIKEYNSTVYSLDFHHKTSSSIASAFLESEFGNFPSTSTPSYLIFYSTTGTPIQVNPSSLTFKKTSVTYI